MIRSLGVPRMPYNAKNPQDFDFEIPLKLKLCEILWNFVKLLIEISMKLIALSKTLKFPIITDNPQTDKF